MYRVLMVLMSFVVACGAGASAAIAGPAPGGEVPGGHFTKTSVFCADSEELAILVLINNHRNSRGLGPLALTQTLSGASDHHSVSMAKHDYFSHDLRHEGITWSQNMSRHGYRFKTNRGENIAAGNPGAAATFEQWRASPGHNANMLNNKFKAIGIGRAYDAQSKYGCYWTTDFGGRVDEAAKVCG